MGKGNIFVLTEIEKKTTTKALVLKLHSHNAFGITFTHTLQALQVSLITKLFASYTNNDSNSIKVLSWFSYLLYPSKEACIYRPKEAQRG